MAWNAELQRSKYHYNNYEILFMSMIVNVCVSRGNCVKSADRRNNTTTNTTNNYNSKN